MRLIDLQFLFITGKGGVGKTTAALALAQAAAKAGKRVLIALCNAPSRLEAWTEVSVDSSIRPLSAGIDVVNMQPEAAVAEYGAMVLRFRAVTKRVFGNRYIQAFLRGTPGLSAWALLGKAYYHSIEMGADGRKRYDLVLVDAPATGHGLEMLRVPQVIVELAPPGLLKREASRAVELFRDPKRAGTLLVTLPQQMPVTETNELDRAVRTQLQLPVQALWVNRVHPPFLGAEEANALTRLQRDLDARSPAAPVIEAASQAWRCQQQQEAAIAALHAEAHTLVQLLPELPMQRDRPAALATLAQTVADLPAAG
ncbi:MAG: ArsA family ATPase [Polyangiales bacterium]